MFVICRDGVLRHEKWFYDRKLGKGHYYAMPVVEYQKHIPHIFLSNLGDCFRFEEGLTLRELMINFKPWQDLMGEMCCMDFPAFVREAEKLPKIVTMTGENADPDMNNYSHIEVYGYVEFDAVPKFTRPTKAEQEAARKRNAWLMGEPVVTDRYNMTISWDYHGVLKTPEQDEFAGEITAYGLHYTPLSDIAHLPIRMRETVNVRDMTPRSSYLSTPEPLFNPNNPFLKAYKNDDGTRVFSYELPIHQTPSFYNAMIRGVFWQMGFHFSPIYRDEKIEEITGSIAKYQDTMHNGDDTDMIEMVNSLDDIADVPERDIPEPEEHEDDDDAKHDRAIIEAVLKECGNAVLIRGGTDEDADD